MKKLVVKTSYFTDTSLFWCSLRNISKEIWKLSSKTLYTHFVHPHTVTQSTLGTLQACWEKLRTAFVIPLIQNCRGVSDHSGDIGVITERICFHLGLVYIIVSDSGNTMFFPCFLLQLLSLKEGIFFFLSDLFTVFYVIYDEIKILVFFLLKAVCSLTRPSHYTFFDSPNTSSYLFFLLFQLSPFLYIFLCTWRTKHPTKNKSSSCLQHLFHSEDYGNFFFSWIIAALHSVMHLLPRPISWTETHSKNFFM